MLKPYTIRLFVPDGNPNTIKIIDKMNWTGIGLEVSRNAWSQYKDRKEFEQAGIYILFGYQEEENDLPTLYIGQGDGVKSRIEAHEKNKIFWDKALVFVSSNGGLNRAHITWLEWALIKKAQEINRCKLDNSITLNEIYSILPLVEIRVFEEAKKIKVKNSKEEIKDTIVVSTQIEEIKDTIVVPAQEEGFKRVFLEENSWYAIRISGGKLNDIKYIAAYQTAPISAITYYAEVESIEPYGDGGKYKLNFKAPAKKIGPIKHTTAKQGTLQGPRYTSLHKLKESKNMTNIF